MKKKLLTLFTALTILLSSTPMVAHATENVTHLDCVIASADNEIDPETADDVSHAIEILENGRESFDDNYDYTQYNGKDVSFYNYDVAIEKKDIQKAHINIMKTERIIEYLWNTLDMKYEVAKDFENMYSYISRRLVEANITKDREIVAEINEHMHAIRDNWVEVMKANNIVVKDA